MSDYRAHREPAPNISRRQPRTLIALMETYMAETTPKRTIYSLTWIYRVDPAFHRLPAREPDAGKAACLEALELR